MIKLGPSKYKKRPEPSIPSMWDRVRRQASANQEEGPLQAPNRLALDLGHLASRTMKNECVIG